MQQLVQAHVLKVEHLEVIYKTQVGPVKAVRDVSFEIKPGDALGLVGESGCGKSTLALAIMNYMAKNARITGGHILFHGEDIVQKSGRELSHIRGNEIAMVYQDAMAALNPSLRIGQQLTEALVEHRISKGVEAIDKCIHMLERVHMPDPSAIMERYCHQLSGGQQQRVLIAMALLNNPALLILDEPTTGLDVTVEAGILDLIDELKHEFETTILYISHNLGVISRVADRIAVMYAGELVEQGAVRDVFLNPQHPYTNALFECIPRIRASRQSTPMQPIRGRVPALHQTPMGCVFEPRCDRAQERCRLEHPDIVNTAEGHLARCLYAGSPIPGELNSLRTHAPALEATPIQREERGDIVLNIEGLKTYYKAQEAGLGGLAGRQKKGFVKAVDDINLIVWKNSTLGIVGESGCGKTTLAKCIAGLVSPTAGKMDFIGFDVARAVEKRPSAMLKELQMIFQNPDSTLNPKRSVGETIARPLKLFKIVPASEIRSEVVRLLEAVKLGEEYYDHLPRHLSGGEKQRVATARAFAGRPTLVLCDEPLSALDVSIQAAVMNLLLEFQKTFGTTMLFISHDLSVVFQLCDYVAVMYLGQFCEVGPVEAIFAPPYHPYTEALLSAVPIADPNIERNNIRLTGRVPSALNPPSGCRFHARCPRKIGPICEQEAPPWREFANGHRIYCHISVNDLLAMEPVISTA
jgi:peptide/nickel transport system ATP-binding protein